MNAKRGVGFHRNRRRLKNALTRECVTRRNNDRKGIILRSLVASESANASSESLRPLKKNPNRFFSGGLNVEWVIVDRGESV